MEGWIKIHRKLLEWEWYKDNNTKILFIHLLLTANHKEKNWQGIKILRGQKITSLQHLAEETNLTVQQVRTSLKKLKSTHEITYTSTKKYTLVTIEKYSLYQDKEENSNTENNTQDNKQVTQYQHSDNNKQECKNDNNIYYINLLNKYKEQIEGKNFGQKIHLINQCQDEEEYMQLNEEEQHNLFLNLMNIKEW